MQTTPLLFIGGPKDGQIICAHEWRNHYEVARLRIVPSTPDHNACAQNYITYKRVSLQVTESERVDVMYYNERGTPLIKHLLDSYANSR